MQRIVRRILPIVLLVLCAGARRAQATQSGLSALLNLAEPSAVPLPDAPLSQSKQPAGTSPSSSTPQTSQTADAPVAPSESQSQAADRQLKQEEQQRVLGVLPTFNISYNANAVSLTAKQKFSLALHTATDPVTIAGAFVIAGYREALDDDIGFRWGPEGYLRRTGASYLDTFDGTIIGNAALPSLLHQDPRYFRLGHSSFTHRFLYSLAANVICKHDNTGKWEPNYSNVLGNIAAGAISNLYYPSGTTGPGQTLTNGLVITVEGAVGTVFDEFWPDISRKVLHKDPTHGQDSAAAQQHLQPAAPSQPAAQR